VQDNEIVCLSIGNRWIFPRHYAANTQGENIEISSTYSRIKNIFGEIARNSSKEIIAHLAEAGEKWRNSRPQNDDITFVVSKVKYTENNPLPFFSLIERFKSISFENN